MSNPSDPIHEKLAAIRAARARVLDACVGVSTSDGARRAEGGWALQDVVEHLVLAERGGFDLIWKAAEAHRAGDPIWKGESENTGRPIEEVVARTFAPRETAPPSARTLAGPSPQLRRAARVPAGSARRSAARARDPSALPRGSAGRTAAPGLHPVPPGPPPGAGPGAPAPDRRCVNIAPDRSSRSTWAAERSVPRSTSRVRDLTAPRPRPHAWHERIPLRPRRTVPRSGTDDGDIAWSGTGKSSS